MTTTKFVQRANIKFSFLLNKAPTETVVMFQKTYMERSASGFLVRKMAIFHSKINPVRAIQRAEQMKMSRKFKRRSTTDRRSMKQPWKHIVFLNTNVFCPKQLEIKQNEICASFVDRRSKTQPRNCAPWLEKNFSHSDTDITILCHSFYIQ